jgi:hypothetical protein
MKILWISIMCALLLPSQVFGQQGATENKSLMSHDEFITYYLPAGYHLVVRFDEATSTAFDVPPGMYLEIKASIAENPDRAKALAGERGKELMDKLDVMKAAGDYPQTVKGDIRIRLKSTTENADGKTPMSDIMASAPFALNLKKVVLVIEKRVE